MRHIIKCAKKGIDAKTTGSTLLFTSESAAERFYPTMVTIEATVANTVLAVPILQIGTNSTSYNNILAATTLTRRNICSKHD